jgi:hypothetical protein
LLAGRKGVLYLFCWHSARASYLECPEAAKNGTDLDRRAKKGVRSPLARYLVPREDLTPGRVAAAAPAGRDGRSATSIRERDRCHEAPGQAAAVDRPSWRPRTAASRFARAQSTEGLRLRCGRRDRKASLVSMPVWLPESCRTEQRDREPPIPFSHSPPRRLRSSRKQTESALLASLAMECRMTGRFGTVEKPANQFGPRIAP